MPLMVTASCDADNCDEYAEVSAGIDDGVNVIETDADGWAFTSGAAYCAEHADFADE